MADASLTLGPVVHELGYPWDDWNRLAAGTVAGHLIECGAQVTGGLWCNWRQIQDWADIGYPYVDLAEDGSFEIASSNPAACGVNRETLSEQGLMPRGQEFLTVGHLYRGIEGGLRDLTARLGERGLFVGSPRAQATPELLRWPQLIAVRPVLPPTATPAPDSM